MRIPDLTINQGRVEDYPQLLTLNQQAVPSVNSIPPATLASLHKQSAYLGVARSADRVVGFLLALPHTASYDSLNFQYFKAHHPAFAYVDRIVVAETARSMGVGAALYHDLQGVIGERFPLLTCEVNIEPPNPGSMRFHARLGFQQEGSQTTEGGRKRVALLSRPLP